MDVMSSRAKLKTSNGFLSLLKHIKRDFPGIQFVRAETFAWSSEDQTIYYDPEIEFAKWSLLHELGHMKHEHNTYSTDGRLVRMEVEAWETAKKLANDYGETISEAHIESCMDSYRNWQHSRSKCPVCAQTGVEKHSGSYHCINCQHNWAVTTNRFCRVYRQTK